jgi:hypothetical protein
MAALRASSEVLDGGLDERDEQRVLAGEVVEQGGLRAAHLDRDVVQRGALEAGPGEHPGGRREDVLPGAVACHGPITSVHQHA